MVLLAIFATPAFAQFGAITTQQVPTQQLVAGTYLIRVNGAAAGKLQVQPD